MKKIASATDPLWYKDAIVYELHVRAFCDSNNDGIGDFPGLLSRLDYLQDLGVTCIWLLPFFPSPLRDDGYDISNYTDVNPSYGTLNDFKAFLQAAHQRDMQVMIELVVNHTSDQHPWFKAARIAPPGSPQRDMYVWSDTEQKYKDARIIFTDTEKSNWAWDEVAKAYYWHRFFSHQPDLNYDSPLVIEEVLKAMRFWLDMGVDGLRMDAIPYLCERDGTSCENLPETHASVRTLRAAIDADYANRLILAEANQWPADVRPYFGDGDECHMAFHFPLMPRIYMALRQEDRLPITDIMAQTPSIPDICQWALFLRNHDELTLEMVTDDERDYMYFAYSADPRMRINVGIRRRLAPLVDNNRHRIELLNSLLFSFPGTPILYYGDEIGMGDNIYLGDRNGVRTPMQWTSDRNAGFSKCDPARLYLPVIMDPIYGYQVVNVEAQLSDQSSLLHWTRNMIALRKLFQVFGRGTLTFLNPTNRKILAYLRHLDRGDGFNETVLCIANLSRFAQPVALDLTEYAGHKPVEMFGYVPFPAVARDPYSLTVSPYSFLWLELQAPGIDEELPAQLPVELPASVESGEPEPSPIFAGSWVEFVAQAGAAIFEPALLEWLPRQRWFGAKTHTIAEARIRNWVELPHNRTADLTGASADSERPIPPALFLVEVTYFDSPPDFYQLPLAISRGADRDEVMAAHSLSVIAHLKTSAGPAILHDATVRDDFRQALLKLIAVNRSLPMSSAATHIHPSADAIESSGEASAGPAASAANVQVSPAPLTAQPGETAAEPRTNNPNIQSASAQRLQPRESPSAGDSTPPEGRLDSRASSAFRDSLASERFSSQVGSAEQSNTAILYGDKLILKIFRRLQVGENPDVEMGRFLTEVAHFSRIPPLYGEISLCMPGWQTTTLAMLQGFVANESDGWQWFVGRIATWLATVGAETAPANLPAIDFLSEPQSIGKYPDTARATLNAAALLGRRTAEMHVALAGSSNLPAFAPEPITSQDLERDALQMEAQIKSTIEALKVKLAVLDDTISDAAATLIARRPELLGRARSLAHLSAAGQRIRIHGDFHLGQTLRTVTSMSESAANSDGSSGDFAILDFEGEPARPIEERRRKQSPLKDVAGMLRSFSYAAHSALDRVIGGNGQSRGADLAARWSTWWIHAATAQFLAAYREGLATNSALLPSPSQAQTLLNAYLLQKGLYEVLYELNNRPSWLHLPINSILTL